MFVAATTVPVLVRANFDNARIWGIEHSADGARREHASRVTTAFTYLRAKDTDDRICRRTSKAARPRPTPGSPSAGRGRTGAWWVEPYLHVGWEQTHLSSLDLGDRRTGSGRDARRASGRSSATARAPAAGSAAGADGVVRQRRRLLTRTGETLAQIQDRVLGVGVNSSSLFPTIPGLRGVRHARRHSAPAATR